MTCPKCNDTGRIAVWSFFGPEGVTPCPLCRPEGPPEQQEGAVREEGNVRILGAVSALDLPPERILNAAIDAELKLCIVVGELPNGEFYFASNHADGPDVLWALERAKLALLRAGGAA